MLEAAGDTAATARALVAVGRSLLAMGQPREAVAELRSATERVPSDLLPKILLAQALRDLGEGQTAIALLNEVLGIDGGNPEALRARGEILADIGDARAAVRDLERLPAEGRPETLAAHGLALAGLGNHRQAAEHVNSAMDCAPRNGVVLFYAARVAALAGDAGWSGELARRAIDATDPPLSAAQRAAAVKLAKDRQLLDKNAIMQRIRQDPRWK